MTAQALDPVRRSAKRERARRRAGDLFLYRRAFAECAERIGLLAKAPERLLIATAPDLEWTAEASAIGDVPVVALDALEPHTADLIIAVGLLDQVDDPSLAAFILSQALAPGGHLLGAALGQGSLPKLRSAMLNAERATGRVVQRFHPMLDAASLAGLLSAAGLRDVVLDADRVEVRYRSLEQLTGDLRDIGCTGSLAGHVPPLGRAIFAQAGRNFLGGAERVSETFETLHFSAVAPIAV